MLFRGHGVVWDVALNKRLCEFEKQPGAKIREMGTYETEDPEEIFKLKAAGYVGEGEEPKVENVNIEKPKEEKPKVEKPKEEKPKKVEFPIRGEK